MDEYSINVSVNGKFLFRTDWDSDKQRTRHAATILQSSMPLAKVTVSARSLSRTDVTTSIYQGE